MPRLRAPQLAKELENTGSVARDHLALERTFLAWLRTSLGLVSLGIAITQLFQIPALISDPDPEGPADGALLDELAPYYADAHTSAERVHFVGLRKLGKPLGATFVALGIVVLLLGAIRFFKVQRLLIGGKFQPSRVEVSVVALLAGALIVAAFGVILGLRLGGSV